MHDRAAALSRVVLCALLCILGSAVRAEAGSCSVSTTPVVFGAYNVFATSPGDSTGTVVYRCTGNVDGLLITISKGRSTTFLPRQLGKGLERLSYNLFRDAARTVVWGDYSAGTSAFIDLSPPNNRNETLTVYGRIPAGQDISAGAYTDSVTLTVNY